MLPYLAYLQISNNKVLDTSYGFLNLTGYSREDVLNKTLQEICGLLFKSAMHEIDTSFIESGKEFFIFTTSNEVRIVTINSFKSMFSNEYYLVFIEKPGSRLEDSLPYAEQLIRSDVCAVAIYGMPGFILLKANKCYLDYLDEPYGDLKHCIGHSASEIIDGWKESPLEDLWRKTVDEKKALQIKEFEFYRPGKGLRFLDAVITPVVEGGAVRYLIDSITDMTEIMERIRGAEELSKLSAQRVEMIEGEMKKKDEFFSFVSHEFKTPLTVINAAIQAMESICHDEISPKLEKFIDQIKKNSLRLLRLANNLLDITRAESGYMKVHKRDMDIVEFTKMLIDSVLYYANQKGIILRFDSSLTDMVIALDEEKYERIMLNLLSNAIKFTSPGKSVTVRVSTDDEMVRVDVCDEGIGIPKEKQEQIFNRFSQVDTSLVRRSGGTGLGLCLTKLLVQALGGEISVDSEEDKGSTFTVLLPSIRVGNSAAEEPMAPLRDSQVIQSAAIEFSDIISFQ